MRLLPGKGPYCGDGIGCSFLLSYFEDGSRGNHSVQKCVESAHLRRCCYPGMEVGSRSRLKVTSPALREFWQYRRWCILLSTLRLKHSFEVSSQRFAQIITRRFSNPEVSAIPPNRSHIWRFLSLRNLFLEPAALHIL
jgi:hypothetical protein